MSDSETTEINQQDSNDRTKSEIMDFCKSYFDEKLDLLAGHQLRLGANQEQLLQNKLKESTIEFKDKGKKIQYDFNTEVLGLVKDAIALMHDSRPERAVTKLDVAQKKLKDRNKLIRIADRSDAGWATVNEYQMDEVASDSDDDRKIRAAEARAMRKRKSKMASSTGKKPRSQSPSNRSNQPFRDNFRDQGGNFRDQAGHFREANYRPKEKPRCFRCGAQGHWARECYAQPSGSGYKGSTQ